MIVSIVGYLLPDVNFISFLAKKRRGRGFRLFGFHLRGFHDGVNQVAFQKGKLF